MTQGREAPYGAQHGYEIPPTYGSEPGEERQGGFETQTQPPTRLKEAISETARDTGQKLRGGAEQIKDTATERANEVFDEQKHAWAGQVDEMARAIQRAAGAMGEEGGSAQGVSPYVRRAADGLSSMARTLREGDLQTLVHKAQDVARQQPALFIGGALALGFGLARFLKSSPDRDPHGDEGGV